MNYILFGMQGSGKGTQSKYLAEHLNLEVFETGEALRSLAEEGSELGNKVKAIMESGNLVPIEVVMEIIENFLTNLPEGKSVLFDGIPRSKEQQKNFDILMKKKGMDFTAILIEISEEEAIRRLTNRRICSKCKTVFPATYKENRCKDCDSELISRSDDTPNAIRIRLNNFTKKTMPVIEDYKSKGKIISINGEQSIEAVRDEMLSKIN